MKLTYYPLAPVPILLFNSFLITMPISQDDPNHSQSLMDVSPTHYAAFHRNSQFSIRANATM